MPTKKNKVRDLKPRKDTKGGGGKGATQGGGAVDGGRGTTQGGGATEGPYRFGKIEGTITNS